MADSESDAHVLSRVLKPVNLRRADFKFDEALDPQVHTSLSSVTANLIPGAIPAPKGYVVMYCQKLSDYVLLYTNKSKSTALMHFGLLECGSSDEEAVPVGYSKPMWNHVEPPMSLAQLEVPIEEGRERSRSPHLERKKNKRAEKEKWLPDGLPAASWSTSQPKRAQSCGRNGHIRNQPRKRSTTASELATACGPSTMEKMRLRMANEKRISHWFSTDTQTGVVSGVVSSERKCCTWTMSFELHIINDCFGWQRKYVHRT